MEKTATSLKGKVNVAAVNVTANSGLAFQYKIKGVPTVKIFGNNKSGPPENLGSRDASNIVAAALKARERMIKERQSGKNKADTIRDGVKINRRFQLKKMVSF